jgi:ubiquinone/menaquinone biosynthesis C-methylase UbiE
MLAQGENEFSTLRTLILAFVKNGQSVLDVGCASGNTYNWAIENGKDIKYKGTDYAEKFIEANKKRNPETEWEVMDSRDLKELDKSWDVVVLYDVIDNQEGWEKSLDEAVRVARDKVILLMWMDNDMDGKYNYLKNKGILTIDINVGGYVHFHRMMVGLLCV